MSPLRVLLDENTPYEAKTWLERRLPSVRADHVHDLGFGGQEDEFLYEWASAQRAVIVTFDADFADQRRFPVGGRCGVLRFRIEPTTPEATIAAFKRFFDEFDLHALIGRLAIVDERRIRLIG